MKRQKKHSQDIQWNRFDICSAWYVYAVLYHGGQSSREYKILGRLVNILFAPGRIPQSKLADGLTANGLKIYHRLVDGGYIRP